MIMTGMSYILRWIILYNSMLAELMMDRNSVMKNRFNCLNFRNGHMISLDCPKNIIELCEIKKYISKRLVGTIEAVWLEIVWLSLGFFD